MGGWPARVRAVNGVKIKKGGGIQMPPKNMEKIDIFGKPLDRLFEPWYITEESE